MDDSHKSRILARAATPSRLEMLKRAGIAFEVLTGDVYRVAGAFVYYPTIGNWRSNDYKQAGYTCASLIQAVRDAELRAMIPVSTRAIVIDPLSEHLQKYLQKPAADGRDSVAAPADPDRPLNSQQDANAESPAAGAKLKVVWP